MRRSAAAALLALAALAASAHPAPAQLTFNGVGQFITECKFSHASHNDPIVFPRRPGASHLHHFFGNRSTRARSTPRSLRRNRTTTCDRPEDASAYWVPALLRNGSPVTPLEVHVYYSSAGKNRNRIEPLPRGLRMIAGDHTALRPQPRYVTDWGCLTEPLPGFGSVGPSSPGPVCPQGGKLLLIMAFPDCWDGRRLDSRDHQRHMAVSRPMSAGGLRECPGSHPVSVPQLGLVIIYPTNGGPGLELSSGGLYSAHGDFMNAWQPDGFRALLADCIRMRRECRV